MSDWLSENWVLLALGVAVLLVAFWWLLPRAQRVELDKPSERSDRGADRVTPVVTGPAIAPIETPPALEPTALPPEPEALVEPIHAIPAGAPDELTRMKGVGPKVAALLNGLGVTRYEQIAAWNDDDLVRVDAQLGAFKGRPTRDQWVEQARLLAAHDTAGFEAKFGKLG